MYRKSFITKALSITIEQLWVDQMRKTKFNMPSAFLECKSISSILFLFSSEDTKGPCFLISSSESLLRVPEAQKGEIRKSKERIDGNGFRHICVAMEK